MEGSPLNIAIQAVKSGDRAKGLRLLTELVKSEPNNELAWLWLSICFDDPPKKKYCLNRALTINPANQNARLSLEQMERLPTGSPTRTASAATGEPLTSQAEPVAAVQAVGGPAVTVSQAPTGTSRPPKSFDKKKQKSLWLLYLPLLIGFLLVCMGSGFFTFLRLYDLLNKQIAGRFGDVNQTQATQSEPAPQNFNQIGVFLLQGSKPLALERTNEGLANDSLPMTESTRPALILNDPQINLPELNFDAIDGNNVLEQIPLKSEEYQGAILATPTRELENGVYCLIQHSSGNAPGPELRWCFQVGQTNNPAPGKNDLSNLNVAPPGKGFFLVEQGQALALPANTKEKLEIENIDSLPSTANRQPVMIVNPADIDLAKVKWNESLWGVGIPELSKVDKDSPGAQIGTVIDGTPAAQANLRSQDTLLAINGQPLAIGNSGKIENYSRLRGLPGTTVKITVQQGTQVLDLLLPRTSLEDNREIEYQVIHKPGYVYLVPKTNLRPGVYYLTVNNGGEMYFKIK